MSSSSRRRLIGFVACLGLACGCSHRAGKGRTGGASLPPARISIDASHVEGKINPQLYGQFMEFMFGGVKGGLHAELLRNRSFEETANPIGLGRYWERYPDDRNDDPIISFTWDTDESYPPAAPPSAEEKTFPALRDQAPATQHSLRAMLKEDDRGLHGIYQSGIPLRAATAYEGYLWIKSKDFAGRVTVALEADRNGGPLYAEAKHAVKSGTPWQRYPFKLAPKRDDPLSRLVVRFDGKGQLWLDQVSLLPGDAVDGVRADVFQRIRALRPAFFRWPGGNVAQDYHWLWAVGPRDRRVTWVNLSWANEPEPSDFGTDEYLRFARRVGAEPTLVVNVEGRGGTAEEAAAWVEYVNGPATSRYGKLRAQYGHPEPYRVRTWEIGNEIWGDWVRGHSDAETYARNYVRYIKAMRAVDPDLRFIATGDNDQKWNRKLLEIAGKEVNLLSVHHYYGGTPAERQPANILARPLFYERFYRDVHQLVGQLVPGHRVGLVINEWNTAHPPGQHQTMLAALFGARLMNVFERSQGRVALSCVSDLLNGWVGGLIQASRHGLYVTPTYFVNQLYVEHLGRDQLAVKTEGPVYDSPDQGKKVPALDAVASRSADGRHLFIKAVNTDLRRGLRATVQLRGATVAGKARLHQLTAQSPTTATSFARPDAVTVSRSELQAGSSFELVLPAHSVSVLDVPLAK